MENSEAEMTIEEVHAALSHTSGELAYLFWEVPRELQLKKDDPNEWCPLEILVHLRQAGKIYTSRVKRVFKPNLDELPLLHDFDEQKQMNKIKLEDETVKANLSEFMKARSELLNKISFIEKEEWYRKVARHEESGEISLLDLLTPLTKREKKYLDKLKILLDTTV